MKVISTISCAVRKRAKAGVLQEMVIILLNCLYLSCPAVFYYGLPFWGSFFSRRGLWCL